MKTFYLLVLTVALPCAAASTPGATLTYLMGKVTVASQPASQGQTISDGQRVQVGEASVAILTMGDGSRIKLNAGSEIALGGGAPAPGDDVVQLNSGGIFSEVTKAKAKHFFVRTKSATMGVRGTRFFTSYGKPGKDGTPVWMCVSEGEVAVESPGQAKPVIVKTGQGVLVKAGGKVTPPKPYEWTRGLNWNMNPAQGDVIDHSSMNSHYKGLTKKNYD